MLHWREADAGSALFLVSWGGKRNGREFAQQICVEKSIKRVVAPSVRIFRSLWIWLKQPGASAAVLH
ncbi:hypothetical protein AMEX_G11273 [Astyanax mexicanus]|uniref:Uncharacterized protein n=1 Tax=Astyanax mexicanus TaxID=7994 RepID=A0A8T2LX35_ASTMX|nr:hypothetical protein AMEX_G11273 [Astyanax mexicanus]